ncbi:outer membrane lipoprotein-sorting protein [Inhella gelatinilytica]|uniref:Outer membrane lipoprotein-sorting protein n=1 Tax=Inhella gelatinilytica TaxID=2795030 RepID=A0A931NDY3_9BURK|nr:outer membrane lipoprotein-sorting protein [Inhella gelatinilytica]MBH9552710.1 outer membrane lipoprotein-sorting protein [Inhella gelatinilytica]
MSGLVSLSTGGTSRRQAVLTLAVLTGPCAWARDADDALGTVRDLWARYRLGVETEQETVRVRVEREGQAPELKRLQRSLRFRPDGGFIVLVRFLEPALDKGLSLLIEQSPGKPALMALRMPSWPQARRIAGDREARSFGGTDLTFEDNRQLLGEAVADWQYRALEGGRIEAQPRAGTASGYGRRVLQVTAEGGLAQVDYFDAAGRWLKTQRQDGLQVGPGGRWRADRVVVSVAGGRSLFEVEQRQFGLNLTEAWFQAQLAA